MTESRKDTGLGEQHEFGDVAEKGKGAGQALGKDEQVTLKTFSAIKSRKF